MCSDGRDYCEHYMRVRGLEILRERLSGGEVIHTHTSQYDYHYTHIK